MKPGHALKPKILTCIGDCLRLGIINPDEDKWWCGAIQIAKDHMYRLGASDSDLPSDYSIRTWISNDLIGILQEDLVEKIGDNLPKSYKKKKAFPSPFPVKDKVEVYQLPPDPPDPEKVYFGSGISRNHALDQIAESYILGKIPACLELRKIKSVPDGTQKDFAKFVFAMSKKTAPYIVRDLVWGLESDRTFFKKLVGLVMALTERDPNVRY